MSGVARGGGGSALPFRRLRAVARLILVAGGLIVVAACALIVVEVMMRLVLRRSLGGVDEIAGFALAVGTSWAFGAVLLDKAHVRIDTLYGRLGERGRAIADIVGLLGTVVFAGTLLNFAVAVLRASVRFGATSQGALAFPVAVPQALWVGGLAFFLVVALALLGASVVSIVRGDWRGVGRLAGARGLEDEIRSEMARTGERGAP